MENQMEQYSDERKEVIQGIVDKFWQVVLSEFDSEDLSEEEMLDVYAALGIISGSGINEAFYINPTLPYQLFGILSDFSHQTTYTARYGLDFRELEEARQQRH